MAFLLHLPPELLQLIFSNLPRQSLSRLSATCQRAYDICLPTLYAQVHLGLRSHVRQLEEGLRRRPKLRETMQKCTTRLILTNQQNCNMWMTRDFAWLFSAVISVRHLTLVHFDRLSVEYLSRLAQQLPAVEHLYIHYSILKSGEDMSSSNSSGSSSSGSSNSSSNNDHHHYHHHQSNLLTSSSSSAWIQQHNLKRETVFSKAMDLRLCWTDFSETAIAELFRLLPNVEQVDLGANRNKIRGANTAAVRAIAEHCGQVRNLTISLQQVSEPVLCDTIAYYGPQLHSLSIRCDGRDTLRCVARYATLVKNLTIRAGTSLPSPSSSSSSSSAPSAPQIHQQAQVILTLADNNSRHEMANAVATVAARREQMIPTGNPNNEQEHGTIVGILLRCPLLVRLEMVSWFVEDVPREVWRGIEAVALRRKAIIALPSHGDLQRQENKTLALGMEELQEIRKQIMAEVPQTWTSHSHPFEASVAPSVSN